MGIRILTRRRFCSCLLATIPMGITAVFGAPLECEVFTNERQQIITANEAIDRLKLGNERVVNGHSINCDLLRQVQETADGQSPFAAIVGCIDSRVPPEIVFDQRIGDVFCARVAGNFVNDDIWGSIEYATAVAGAKAVVILGHSSCGSVISAIDGVKMGHITGMLANISPALTTINEADGERSSDNKPLVQKIAVQNAILTANSITERSQILKKLHDTGELIIVPAMHDVATGKVTWL